MIFGSNSTSKETVESHGKVVEIIRTSDGSFRGGTEKLLLVSFETLVVVIRVQDRFEIFFRFTSLFVGLNIAISIDTRADDSHVSKTNVHVRGYEEAWTSLKKIIYTRRQRSIAVILSPPVSSLFSQHTLPF